MCLAIPMKVLELKEGGMAQVSVMGAEREVAIDLTPQAKVGDYVLVHAGFAIEVVDEQYAQDTLSIIQEMSDIVDDPLFSDANSYTEQPLTPASSVLTDFAADLATGSAIQNHE